MKLILIFLSLFNLIHSQPTLFPTVPTTKTPTTSQPTASPSTSPTYSPNAVIYFYSTNTWEANGLLGSRSESTWYCENAAIFQNIFCQTHAAFVSYSAVDNLINLVGDHLHTSATLIPVKGPTGISIADNWNSLFSTTLHNSLTAAGVMSNTEELNNVFFSGSLTTGEYAGATSACNGWTSSNAVDKGTIGSGDDTENSFLTYGDSGCDGQQFSGTTTKTQIVCACFHDGS